LIYQDEMEIHLHPTLTRMWALRGHQPEVPAPGKNEKRTIYGGLEYKTGKFIQTAAASKCGAEFIVFLTALLTAYVGRRICLVCDNGRFHHTKAVQEFLTAHRDQLRIYWLPTYSPSLNLIERFWGHLKRTILANVLYKSITDLQLAFDAGVAALNGKREKMDFIFRHDEFCRQLAEKLTHAV
jgi:transposase